MAMNVGQFPHRWRNWDVLLTTKEVLKRIETIKKTANNLKETAKTLGIQREKLWRN